MRHIYDEAENQVFLNAYTYIQLEIFADLRLDKFQQSVNEVGGVQIKDYNSTNDKVAFNIDRISLSQITDIVEKYEQRTGVDIYSDTLRVTSKMITEGKLSGLSPIVRGKGLNPVVSIEIPYNEDHTKFIKSRTQYDIQDQPNQQIIITEPIEDILISTPSQSYTPFPMNLYNQNSEALSQSDIDFHSYAVRDIR